MTLELKHVRALEELNAVLNKARGRKRKTLRVDPVAFERYEEAIKAALPPLF